MEIILIILMVGLVVYFDGRIKKATHQVGELTDKQTRVVVEFFVSKLQDKGIFRNDEIESLYQDINQKIKNEVKLDVHK